MLYKQILHNSFIFQHIINNMHDGVITINYSGIITTMNSAAEKIIELKKEEVLSKNYSEIFLQYPDNDDFNQTVFDAIYESSTAHHKVCNYFTGKSLKSLFVTTSLLKINENNEDVSLGVTIVFSDITELQELRDASLALDKIKVLNKKLEHLSYIDELTGLPNRRYFNDVKNKEWNSACRNNNPLSLILIDIDYFKQTNDTFGHKIGDECLKSVAKTLKSIVQRSSDFVSRYGGDEFVALLPQTDQAAAEIIAKSMQESIANLNIKNPLSPFGIVTISLGIASQVPSSESHPDDLFNAADIALYRGKNSGRNNVTIYSP